MVNLRAVKWMIVCSVIVALLSLIAIQSGKFNKAGPVNVELITRPDDLGTVYNLDTVIQLGVEDPNAAGIEYPQTAEVGTLLLGVSAETGDYQALRMDVEGYIMCKDANKKIFKLVPKEE